MANLTPSTKAKGFYRGLDLPKKVEFLKKHCGFTGGKITVTQKMMEIIYSKEELNKPHK